MNEWIPPIAIIPPDRQVILDLIKLCKKEMAYRRAVVQTLQLLANTGRSSLANQFADQIKALSEATPPTDEDVLFRPVESALNGGQEYLQGLQAVLSKLL